MVQLAYSPPKQDENLKLAFQDHLGQRWYEPVQMPLMRKLEITKIFMRIYTGISQTDISHSLETIQKAIIRKENNKMKPDIAMVSHVCRQLLSRSGFVINMDDIYHLMALYFVTEYEESAFVNNEIINKKIEILKHESMYQKTIDFFYSHSLDKLFPFLKDFDGTLQEVILASKIEIEAFTQQLKSYGRSNTG